MNTKKTIYKHPICGCCIIAILLVQSCSPKGTFHIGGNVGDEIKQISVNARNSHPSSSSYKKYHIRNGKVSLDLNLDSNKVYELDVFINKATWIPCYFFADGKDITIKPGDSTNQEWVVISDSQQNAAYQEFKEGLEKAVVSSGIRDSIKNASVSWDETYTPEYLSLYARYCSDTVTAASRASIVEEKNRMEKDGRAWTEAGRQYNSVRRKLYVLEEDYYKEHIMDMPFGLASFCVLVEAMENAQSNNLDLGYWLAYYQNEYADKFPDCNLHYDAMDVIGKSNMIEGKHYVDFSLPDDKGQIHTVSELIEGRVAVIELWASWCRPCRERMNALKPLYEKYKDAGFVVVSAAREDKSDKAWRSVIEKEKYPWVNLVDMDPWHPVWSSYGDANSSGSAFLFGTDGCLIKKNPTLQDIEDVLLPLTRNP